MRRALIGLTLVCGCAPDSTPAGPTRDDVDLIEGRPTLDAACDLDPEQITGLIVTTTDFSTGAVSVVDVPTRTVTRDVALGSTDAIPSWHRGKAFLVNRHGHDFVDVLEPERWRSLGQYAIDVDGTSAANPHSIAFSREGEAFVPLFASPDLQVLDLDQPPGSAAVGSVDLSPFADEDGNPEASLAVGCGDTVFVTVQRLDRTFARADYDAIVAVDAASRRAYDLELRLRGQWARQIRRDRADPTGHTLLVLTTGIERVDLDAMEVSWAVSDQVFAAAGIEGLLLPQSFDVDEEFAYVASYTEDFGEVVLYRVGLDGNEPLVPESFAGGFLSAERTLEVIGSDLWFGSTRAGEAGLFVFDLGDEIEELAGPLSTGLPPYSLAVMGP